MRIFVANIPVDNLSMAEAIDRIKQFLNEDKPHFAVAINPEKVLKAYKDRELLSILQKSDLNFVDGIGVIWASKLFYHQRFKARVPGIDLFLKVLDVAAKKQYSVFLLGSKEETLQKAIINLKKEHPDLKIAGFHNGYFSDEQEIVEKIQKAGADLLFVGMGSPKQEKFIYKNLSKLNVKFAMGVGGSFNVLAGEYSRAPDLVQKLGLEWLYRFILDPKRLPRVLSLPKFILLVMKVPQKVEDEVNFFGIKISNRSLEKNLNIVQKFLQEERVHLIVTLNGEMASKAFQDREFLDVLKKADLIIPDGIG
jgi:N-acetylglucosaminyldiphosphoundecaprenol N-acetyl-beta-D-mannosaminyltransferase